MTTDMQGRIAEQMKDMAQEIGARALRATIPSGADGWVTIDVRYASIWGNSADGWDVTTEEGGL